MDLAKRDTPLRSQPQTTFRRETTMPRQATDLPGLEVNAAIHRPDTSAADQLSKLLGLATDTAQKAFADIQDGRNQADQAQATLDFSTNTKNEDKFAKSRAYRDAWQLQGAKKLAIDVSTEVTDKFNTALNDPDHPATLDDLDHIFEETVKGHLLDEHGKPLDFITPQAKMTLGTALAKLKQDLMPKAAEAIKTQQDTKLFATTFHNMMFERGAGQEIGAPTRAQTSVARASADVIDAAKPPPIPKGWKGNQEDAIRELGMTAEEAAKFLKTGKDPRPPQSEAKSATTTAKAVWSSVILPNEGSATVTDTNGAPVKFGINAKSNPGVDVKNLTEAGARAVFEKKYWIPSGANKLPPALAAAHADTYYLNPKAAMRILKDAGGSFDRYMALRKQYLDGVVNSHEGDPKWAGVRESYAQRDRNILNFAGGSPSVLSDGSGPELQTAQAQLTPRPGFNIEGFMSSLPPSVDKGEAKVWLINNLIAEAASSGDTSLLNGLENSTRKDGTPSFTPDERIKIADTRDRLVEKTRVETERADRQLKDNNYKLVLQAMVEGKSPSPSWLAEQSRKGLLDARDVYSLTDHIAAQEKSDAAQARSEARQAQAEEDNNFDAEVYSEESALRAGIGLNGASFERLKQRMANGDFGTGKKAAARMLRLQAAAETGKKMTEQNPQFAYYSGLLEDNFKPVRDNGRLMLLKPQAAVDKATYGAMVAYYEEKVHSGEKPGDAYREAVQKYTPKQQSHGNGLMAQAASIKQQMDALRAKKAAAGR